MPDGSYASVIGLTGAFGSGCTTAAKAARDDLAYKMISLSQQIKDAVAAKGEKPTRETMQSMGDEMRKTRGGDVLVREALEKLEAEAGPPTKVVIDGIRNTQEIDYLQKRFGYGFALVAVLAPVDDRWARLKTVYTDDSLNRVTFLADDRRDRNEDAAHGQQVDLCVDRSDVFIANASPQTIEDFRTKVGATFKLITGEELRPARSQELLMNLAYGRSHASRCIKRHVGAAIADPETDEVISLGYNENPRQTLPCVDDPNFNHRCFRDRVRNQHFARLADTKTNCPACGTQLPLIVGPPWTCPSCAEKGIKSNLELDFFPDRAMFYCTAIHAEAWAILEAGSRAAGAHLYTTTFPCFQCAEKIIQVGITKVYYTEAYPDLYSEQRLLECGITLERFEGVRSSAFERIFGRLRPT